MAKQLSYIAQQALDLYYVTYKSDFQFYDLDDFILYTGNAITAIYQKYYEAAYKELKGDRKDEIVTFDTGMLSEQELEVTSDCNDVLSATLTQPFMVFMWDQQNTGVQSVVITEPYGSADVERTSQTAKWHLKYNPKTNTVWYYPESDKIFFINKGSCNIKKVKVFYIPEMYPEALIADGIVQDAIANTVTLVRQLTDKTVVKKTLDNNENKLLETELNTNAIR